MKYFSAMPLLAAGALLFNGCSDSEKQERGMRYVPDMYESPAYRSNQAQVVTVQQDEKNEIHHVPMMMTPVAGTVSRDTVPYALDQNDWIGARALMNPVAPTADVLRSGQAHFNIFCATCHGNDGDAKNGYVSATFSGIPSINTTNVAALSDGEIYHAITMGRGRMPNYRAQLLPKDRWAVVLYTKILARATIARNNAEDAFKAAQMEIERNPTSTLAKEAIARAQVLLEGVKRDQAMILSGEADAEAFVPRPAPVPEYVRPQWPEQ
jgi:mono/diheme cytochrome c family protein